MAEAAPAQVLNPAASSNSNAAAKVAPHEASASPKASARSFVLRRIHSLTGLIPAGAFLVMHIAENSKALNGAAAFNEAVHDINGLLPTPYFYGLELFGLLLPLAFHALYGMSIIFSGQANTSRYAYGSNWLYRLQRWTGIIVFFFLLFHFLSLRVGVSLISHLVTYRDLVEHFSTPVTPVIYLIGVLAAEFHLANGLNGFAWSWGLTVSDRSRRFVSRIAWLLFAAMAIPSVHLILFLHNE
jgi:succinate dehydrogenase / fumarate reductase cytochrome b subunit